MACAVAGAGVLLTIGVRLVLWVFVGATGISVLGRLLYGPAGAFEQKPTVLSLKGVRNEGYCTSVP